MSIRAAGLATACVLLVAAGPAEAVIGGKRASRTQYAWIGDFRACSSTLIAPDRIITAAHCVAAVGSQMPTITFGTQHRHAVNMAIHPAWVSAMVADGERMPPNDDVAVVQLDQPLAGVEPIALQPAPLADGAKARILGAGQTHPPTASYTVKASDAGRYITCAAQGMNAGGVDESPPAKAALIAAG